MNKKILSLLVFALFVSLISFGFKGVDDKDKRVRKPNVNDHYKYIAANQILMWVSNNGDGSHDPFTDANGFYWPGGENAVLSAIFEDGLIYAGKLGREVRMNGNTHRQGLQAGKILDDGNADDPTLEKYRVYRIKKGWENFSEPARSEFEKDYNEWPVEDGAPWIDVDGDGVFTRGVDEPEFTGDEVLWYVANDLDEARTLFTYGSLPLGLEFQTTIFGFNRTGALGDMVFKKYKIINKGGNRINDMYLGYWSDTDLGNAADDFTGCDTVLSLGYTYNGDNNDDGAYGTAPPALGYDFFQGPIVPANPGDSAKFLGTWRHGFINLPMTAFTFYINVTGTIYRDPTQGQYSGTLEFYNYMRGFLWNGDPFVDPNTGQEVPIILSGDPVAGTGWYEGPGWPGGPAPDDRRHLMVSGPFVMQPGDTQEVVVGIVIARGSSNINSITALKVKDIAAQTAYDLDFNLTPPPPAPILSYVPQDQAITIYWQPNAESYDEGDPLIYGQGFSDTTYTFEGYRIWQFRDITGADPTLLATVDIENNIVDINDIVNVNGIDVSVPVIKGTNTGIQRFMTITIDQFTNGPLRNGNPYYFGVSAYGYSPFSAPLYLETPATSNITEVMPGQTPIDLNMPYASGDDIVMPQTQGHSDALVRMKVIVPEALTGDEYTVQFQGAGTALNYSLINLTKGDTLIRNSTDFNQDSTKKPIIDGFVLLVRNIGLERFEASVNTAPVKSILEIKGPGGVEVTPRNVVTGFNSTGKWRFIPPATPDTDRKQNINWSRAVGTDDYEIRFTTPEEGSEYYVTNWTAFTGPLRDNIKGFGKVPMQIFMQPRETENFERMMIKVSDNVLRDTSWTKVGQNYEPVYAYTVPGGYTEPIPLTSGVTASTQHRFGNFSIQGELPEPGSVVRIETWKPVREGDKFTAVAIAPTSNPEIAKANIDKITVFPNPYFGASQLERDKYQRFVRFTGLPNEVTVRIFTISGVFIQRIDKNSPSQWLDWDLRNKDGLPVASGIYLAYLDIPNVGTTVLKIAVIMETQFIDRL
jgi:hypothetical protein